MSGFQQPITIYSAMRYIEEKEYLIPAFQREFVWNQEQIEGLFDSLMQAYPIGSMLFWRVKGNIKTDFRFYKFLDYYVEGYHTHNEPQGTIAKDFSAILDGQQRLTALHIGLFGTYACHEYKKKWDYSPNSYPERKLYFCITKTNTDKENDREYLFSLMKTNDTGSKDLYVDDSGETWFRVGKIIDLHLSNGNVDLDDFCEDNSISRNSKKMLRLLENRIFTDLTINYYLEEDQSPDKVVNIFTRINSGGTHLSMYDILFSITVANWKKDARTEINGLIDRINNKGFCIGVDYVLKAFLFLYHRKVKYAIDSFSSSFCSMLEERWEAIRDSIESLFDLLLSYGLGSSTLTSNNATLPILYYIYHKGVYAGFADSVAFAEDRKTIKKWLYSVMLRRGFGGQSDSALTSARKAFTDDMDYCSISCDSFPGEEINRQIIRHLDTVDDELIDNLLSTQKDNGRCFPILSMLYPNLDYKNNNFHKDHLHPAAFYDNLPEQIRKEHPWSDYNSIVNLQMLDANENESKSDRSLAEWVQNEISKSANAVSFYDSHIIPQIDLSPENFDEFYQKRKKMLSDRLKNLLA